MKTRVGIDFGGVIVRNLTRVAGEDTGLCGDQSRSIANNGVYEAIREIVSICRGSVWIVSKAGTRMQERTRVWLDEQGFFKRTDLNPEHVRFCLQRQEKERICRELKISHFIDDRIHVMQILRHTVPHLYLYGGPDKRMFCPPWATYVSAWEEVPGLLRASIDDAT